MGILLAFAIGWVVGARAGKQGLEEVTAAVVAIRDSEEFHGLLEVVRSHASGSLLGLSNRPVDAEPAGANDVLGRIRSLFPSSETTSPVS